MGNWRRVNLPLVGFKPNPIIVHSDSQGGDAIQELVQGRKLHRIHLLGVFGVNAKGIFNDLRGHRWLNSRTGGHGKAAQPEGLAWGQYSSRGDTVLDNKAIHQSCLRRHSGTLNESTNVGVKTGGSRVGGSRTMSKVDGNMGQGTQCLPRFGPSLWR